MKVVTLVENIIEWFEMDSEGYIDSFVAEFVAEVFCHNI
jgi:hypothetical protein